MVRPANFATDADGAAAKGAGLLAPLFATISSWFQVGVRWVGGGGCGV